MNKDDKTLYGVKKDGKKVYCGKCGKELNMSVPDLFNFCPFCSFPINLVSYNLFKERANSIKTATFKKVIEVLDDKNDLIKLQKLLDETLKK